jgi:hypothetical protein
VSGDRRLSSVDIDILSSAVRNNATDAIFDLNGDQVVDQKDRQFLIESVFKTTAGDANLDGKTNFTDFLALAANFNRDGVGWKEGDFDGDGRVSFSDFLLLAASFANN